MPEITNSTVKAECARVCAKKRWDGSDNWDSMDAAIVVVRTVLTELGVKDMLTPETAEERLAVVKIIKPLITAAVNYQREYLHKTLDDNHKPLAPMPPKREDKVFSDLV